MISNEVLVSIGMPVFKAAYFEKSLVSILNQTYRNIEIIVINDGSPDDFDLLLSNYNDKRIRYFKNKENIGSISLVRTWNMCLELSNGSFFILASDDDIYDLNYVSEMVNLAKKYPLVDLFHSRVARINKDGIIENLTPSCPEYETCFDFIWHRINGFRLQYAPDFMCRTNSLVSINGFVEFPLAWFSDDATWFRLSLSGGIAYSNKILFYFRYSGLNITSSGRANEKIKATLNYKKWFLSFLKEIPDKLLPDETISRQFMSSFYSHLGTLLSAHSLWSLIKLSIETNDKDFRMAILIAFGKKLLKLNRD